MLKRSFPKVQFKPKNEILDKKRNDFDYHLPMGSLYKQFMKEIINNRKAKAFLFPDPKRIHFWQKRLNDIGNGPYIGIS